MLQVQRNTIPRDRWLAIPESGNRLPDAIKIGIMEFPGHFQMGPETVENLLKPGLACKLLGADFFLMIDVVLLDLAGPNDGD
jgi:hypothetical protein